MVDGLLGLLRDTIHLTLQAAFAEQGNVVLVEPVLALETDPNMEISNNAAAGSAAPSSAGSTSAGAGAGPQVAGFGFSGAGGDYYGWDLGWGGSDGGEGGEGGFVPPPPSEAAWEALMSGGAQQLGAAVRRRLQATVRNRPLGGWGGVPGGWPGGIGRSQMHGTLGGLLAGALRC